MAGTRSNADAHGATHAQLWAPAPRQVPWALIPTLVLLGFLGVHHFYLGKVGRGIGYLLTFGWFMIGLLVDLFTLPSQVRRVNYERRAGFR